jgi:peptidoglycan/xylan/chitin deacetylase (PgdA/CDA1 family)
MHKTAYLTTSWDDGYPLDMRIAELLNKYGLPGTFYVPLANDRPVLEPQQVAELSKAFEIGGHTVHHCDLLTVNDDIAQREITDCKAALEQIVGRACTAFCFPRGHFRRKHLALVREAGYRAARTVEYMATSMPQSRNGLAVLTTTLQAGSAGISVIIRNSFKRLRPLILFRYLHHRNPDWAGTAESILRRVMEHGGVFHLWGHSWEIDALDEWDNLEAVFATLAQYKDHAVLVTNSGLLGLARNNIKH